MALQTEKFDEPIRVLLRTWLADLQKTQLPVDEADEELMRRFREEHTETADTIPSEHLVTRISDGKSGGRVDIVFDLNMPPDTSHPNVVVYNVKVEEDSMPKMTRIYNPNFRSIVNNWIEGYKYINREDSSSFPNRVDVRTETLLRLGTPPSHLRPASS